VSQRPVRSAGGGYLQAVTSRDEAVDARVLRTVRAVFGHQALRPGQGEAVRALVSGRDVLVVMPTGGGKSLTYQLPGVLREGTTLVVSPLLALQRDQIDSMVDGTGLRAARLSSAESESQRETVLADAAAGRLDFLFLAPEQLAREETVAWLANPGSSAVNGNVVRVCGQSLIGA